MSLNESVNANEFMKTLEEYTKILADDPRNVPIRVKMAELYVLLGNIPQAVEEYLLMARAYDQVKLVKMAMKYYLKAQELDNTHPEAQERLCELYIQEGMEREAKLEALKMAQQAYVEARWEKAEGAAQKAITLKSIEARYLMGLIHLQRDMEREAVDEFLAVLKCKPQHEGALVCLGRVYVKREKWQEAEEAFRRVGQVNAEHFDACEGLARVYTGRGEWEKAVEAWKKLSVKGLERSLPEKTDIAVQALLEIADGPLKRGAADMLADIFQFILKFQPECARAREALSSLLQVPSAESPLAPVPTATPSPVGEKPTGVPPPQTKPAPEGPPMIFSARGPRPAAIPLEVKSLPSKAAELMSAGLFQEAIQVLRDLVRQDPCNFTARKALHEAYRLLADATPADGTMGTMRGPA